MPNEVQAPSVMEQFAAEFVTPILTADWITWENEAAATFSTKIHALVELVNMLRQRHDEQLDNAQNVGKFPNVKRIRKARSSDDEGPKVDPLAAALAALTVGKS